MNRVDLWRQWAGLDNPDGTPVCDDCTDCHAGASCVECPEPQCVTLHQDGADE